MNNATHATHLYPPIYLARITGAVQCVKTDEHTTLIYEDGTQETVATTDLEKLHIDWQSWISIVSNVQHLRPQ